VTTVIGSIREYFLLDQARATAKAVPEATRVALSRQLALGRQRAEAADALWSNGHVAEGLRLAAEAFEATLGALEPLGRAVSPVAPAPVAAPAAPVEPAPASDEASPEAEDASAASESPSEDAPTEEPADAAEAADEPPAEVAPTPAVEEPRPAEPVAVAEPDWAALLRRRGLSEGKTREVLDARRQLAAKTLPSLDDEVSAADGELFQQLAQARRHVDRVIAPASMTSGQLSWTRASRIGFAAFVALATAVGLYLVLRPATGVTATGSGQWSAEFSPDRAVDGDPATEWLLPDRQAGWLDLRIAPATRMERIRLKNSHNRHYNDRATQAYTIEVYSNDQLVRTVEGEWSGIAPRPEWTDHALGIDDVNRVRIQVRSWHRVGGGLAEVDWD
jgi:hypothetical protein